MSAQLDHLLPAEVSGSDPSVAALRREARQRLMTHGFPDLRTEQWKYTSLRVLEKRQLSAPTSASAGTASVLPERPFACITLHFDNGRLKTRANALPAGMQLSPLSADRLAVEVQGGRAEAFQHLNVAAGDEAWCLRISADQAQAIRVAMTTSEDFASAVHPRLHLVVDDGVSITLLEDHDDFGQGLMNMVMTLEVGAAATVHHVLHRQVHESVWVQHCQVDLAAGAHYRVFAVDRGGRLIRQDHTLNLNAAGAYGSVMGVALINTGQHVDWHTCINHHVGGTNSEESCRMLADGLGVGVFNGRIYIARGADDAHSQMNTANLLLSDQARINTKPELEIYAEEVTASHGATIGQLDADALFYLRSRGLDAATAGALLKMGFAAAPLDDMPESAIKEWLLAQLQAAL